MHVPLIHRLTHLQASLISLQKQNPSFLSVSICTLCKWGALILAFIATFRTITNILIIRFRQNAPSLSSIPLLNDYDGDDYSDTEEEEDETTSSSSDSEDDNEDDAAEHRNGEYFRVRGSDNGDGGFLRRHSIGDLFSLAEIANSKSVVKLWDTIGLGLGLGFNNSDSSDFVSVYDDDEDRRIRPVATGKPPAPAVSCASRAVVVSAGESASGNLAVRIWDRRLRRRMPAVIAEWGPTVGKTVGVESGGVQKVYVRDDGRYGFTVGDMRNVRSPLENVTESNVDDTWWPNSFLLQI